MAYRDLTPDEVEFSISAEMDDIPVRGNALASGDDDEDREYEDEIIRRLDSGDVWAWAHVTVTASWGEFTGEDHLGGCSYADEADFCQPGGYYDDMKAEALDRLNANIQATGNAIAELQVL